MYLKLITTTLILFSTLTLSSLSQEIRTGEFNIVSSSRQILGDDVAQSFANIIKPDDEFT